MKIVCDWQHCGHSTALFSRGATALGGGCWSVCAVAQLWQMTLVKEVGSKITPKQPSSPLHLTCFILLGLTSKMCASYVEIVKIIFTGCNNDNRHYSAG